ncbi:hypothetical protein SOV_33000 [Sporomusa ovata DSM 2662]|uniref:DUF1694 domain-containing protein n=1 Tax=Sporomusa ovata TaxID=2378 RepID=A0A0U1L295_9FIRM|nr:DUF1694 domain-containing protein [Sporomusa ovata]EQB25236.1 hypothetical protein SOV_5c04040 [Sporomusa ovata DSM 2662]CQR73797.1 DUF1694 domain-containing protein [Sporomusa ovata]
MSEHTTESKLSSTWGQNSDLENALLVGMHGIPELKKDEKAYYLGQFKERIIKLLTKKQVAEPIIYPEIIQALKDKYTDKMLIDGTIAPQFYEKYTKLASDMKVPYTILHGSEYKDGAGLIIASKQAVDYTNIQVESRHRRLRRLGLSHNLIDAVGKKVCKKCYKEIEQVAPQEEKNYCQLSWINHLLGERCPVHKE